MTIRNDIKAIKEVLTSMGSVGIVNPKSHADWDRGAQILTSALRRNNPSTMTHINVPIDQALTPAQGASMEIYRKAYTDRTQEFTALANDAGLSVYTRVEFHKNIEGNLWVQHSLGQLTVDHAS